MKAKFIFLILSVIIPLFSVAQTPTILETQNWIKDIIEGYVPNDNDGTVQNGCEILFLSSKIIITTTSKDQHGWNYEGVTVIPISKISSVRIVPFSDVYNIVFRSVGISDISYKSNYSKELRLSDKSQTISLSKKIDENDLKNRLIKAFKYLVKENGGQIKDDPF